jgi:hypothetical protein
MSAITAALGGWPQASAAAVWIVAQQDGAVWRLQNADMAIRNLSRGQVQCQVQELLKPIRADGHDASNCAVFVFVSGLAGAGPRRSTPIPHTAALAARPNV